FPTRRSSDLEAALAAPQRGAEGGQGGSGTLSRGSAGRHRARQSRHPGRFATMAGDRSPEPGMPVTIGIARESAPGARRVAATPEACRKLVAAGAVVRVERGLGDGAHFPDAAYADAGAELVGSGAEALGQADIALCVQAPEPAAIAALRQGAVLVGSLHPDADPARAEALRANGI